MGTDADADREASTASAEALTGADARGAGANAEGNADAAIARGHLARFATGAVGTVALGATVSATGAECAVDSGNGNGAGSALVA